MPEWFGKYLDKLTKDDAEELYTWFNTTGLGVAEDQVMQRLAAQATTDRRG